MIIINWNKVLSTDEKSFVRRRSNEKYRLQCVALTLKHGMPAIMFWGSMCAQEVGPLIQCDGIINVAKCIDIVKEAMTPGNINHLFSDGLFHFKNDNEPIHTARITKN